MQTSYSVSGDHVGVDLRVAALATILDGWAGPATRAPTAEALEAGRKLANVAAQLVPTTRGGVQVEWVAASATVEVELGPDGRVVGASFQDCSGEED